MFRNIIGIITALIFVQSLLFSQASDIESREVFVKVEEMPLYGGCETMECSNEKVVQFLASHLKYPEEARESDYEGKVIVRFIVESDGSASKVSAIGDVKYGCGDEAVRVINLMNSQELTWRAGRQRGRHVAVLLKIPVNFKL